MKKNAVIPGRKTLLVWLVSLVGSSLAVAQSTLGTTVATGGGSHAMDATPVRSGWALFQDATLDSLIDAGLRNNPDVQLAISRVEEARIRVRIAESYQSPSVRGSLYFATQSLSQYRPVAIPVASDQLPRFQLNTFQIPIDVSYEIDLFQRIRQTVRVADLQRQVSESDVQITQLVIASEIARLYYLIRANDSEQAVIERNLTLRDSTLAIIRARFKAGLTNEIDARRAETDIAAVQVQQQGLQRSRGELVNALSVLIGAEPAAFTGPPARRLTLVPEVPITAVSAEQLRRRPDLRQAEQLSQAADVQIQVNRAALYPRINILGTAGTLTGRIGTLFFPASATYLIGLNASVPIFEGRRNQENIALARQQFRTTQTAYTQRLLLAQREAETALDNLQGTRRQLLSQNQALQSARQTEQLTRELYIKGLITFLEVLDAQRTALEAERQLVLLQSQQAVYTIALMKALGGSL